MATSTSRMDTYGRHRGFNKNARGTRKHTPTSPRPAQSDNPRSPNTASATNDTPTSPNPCFFLSFVPACLRSCLPSFLPFYHALSFLFSYLRNLICLILIDSLLIHVDPNYFFWCIPHRGCKRKPSDQESFLSSPSTYAEPSAVFSGIRYSTASSPAAEATETSLLAYHMPIITQTTQSIRVRIITRPYQ